MIRTRKCIFGSRGWDCWGSIGSTGVRWKQARSRWSIWSDMVRALGRLVPLPIAYSNRTTTLPSMSSHIHARPRNTLQRDKHTDYYYLLHTLMPTINPNCASWIRDTLCVIFHTSAPLPLFPFLFPLTSTCLGQTSPWTTSVESAQLAMPPLLLTRKMSPSSMKPSSSPSALPPPNSRHGSRGGSRAELNLNSPEPAPRSHP